MFRNICEKGALTDSFFNLIRFIFRTQPAISAGDSDGERQHLIQLLGNADTDFDFLAAVEIMERGVVELGGRDRRFRDRLAVFAEPIVHRSAFSERLADLKDLGIQKNVFQGAGRE